MILASLLLSACAPASTAAPAPTSAPANTPSGAGSPTAAPKATEPPKATAVPASKYKEAPALAEQVKAGKLPAVDQRLPEKPVVVKPIDSVGKYGGTIRTALLGGGDLGWLAKTIFYDNLVVWDATYTKPIPNIAESWEVSPDGKVYSFKLAKGLKWSDGKPFTTEDIAFAYELFSDDTIVPGKDAYFKVGGKLAEFTKVDELSFKFTFVATNGLFLQRLCSPDSAWIISMPKHAVSKYYPKYNPDANKLAKDKGYDDAVKYLTALWNNWGVRVLEPAEFPTMTSFKLTVPYGAKSTVVTAERNPYYFKVDTEGNQLPYVDKWTFDVGADAQALLLKAVNGEIDLYNRHINTLDNKSVLFDNQAKGNYSFYTLSSINVNLFAMAFNLTNKDETKRKIFNDKNFRIGMSHAINRQEVIDTVYVGQGKPMQVAVPPVFKDFYNEQLATQYLEFSVDKANAALDKAGLDKRDADKFRLGPDGKRFIVTIETYNTDKSYGAVLEMLKKYWEKVGVKTDLQIIDRTLLQTHIDANDYEAIALWSEGGGGGDLLMNPRWFVPVSIHSGFGPGWYFNYLGDSKGKDWTPPENVAKSITIYKQLQQTVDVAKQNDLIKQLVQQAADNFFAIGIGTPIDDYGIVSNKVQNMPKTGLFSSYNWPAPAPVPLTQLWIKQ